MLKVPDIATGSIGVLETDLDPLLERLEQAFHTRVAVVVASDPKPLELWLVEGL